MFAALRSPDFRLLWLGQCASQIGNGLVVVAVGLFVTRLTGSAAAVGAVLAAYTVPLIAFLLIGGVIGDRMSRRTVMIASDLVRAVLHSVLAVLIATGAVRVWHMVVIGALFGTAEAFFKPAYTGLVPETVPPERLQSAQALGGLSRQLAIFASPALATILVLTWSAAVAFALDAATFLVSAALLVRLRNPGRERVGKNAGMWSELREGWQAFAARTWVWGTVAAFAVAGLTGTATFFTLGPTVASQVYGSDAVYGAANVARGVGMVAGALWAARWRPLRPMRAALIAAIAWTPAAAVFGLGPPVAVTYAAMAVSGLGIGLFVVWWETALAERIPPELLSRVSAYDWMGSLALVPVGYLLAGPLARLAGEVEVLVVGGLIGGLAMACALMSPTTRAL